MKDYIKNIRQFVGNSPLVVVASGAIILHEDKILLQKKVDSNNWAIHGGALELGETVEETFFRELKEELGITPTQWQFYKIFSGKNMHYTYPNGDEIYCVNIIYICTEYSGNIQLQKSEVMELRWFNLNEIPPNINSPIDRTIINDYIKNRGNVDELDLST